MDNQAIIDHIMFYLGYRAGRIRKTLPMFPIRTEDIQVPSRDIIHLINGTKTLEELLAEIDKEFPDGTTE